MNLHDLQKALRAVEPAAVLVPPRVLDNILWQVYNLSGLRFSVPHRRSAIVDRQTLFRHVEQEDLVLAPDQLLPATVILLAWPTGEAMQTASAETWLQKYWQRLFHSSIHLLLENHWAEGKLTPVQLQERLAALGRTEFEEIRQILVDDGYLLPEADDRQVYFEFAAVFLERHFFTPTLLPNIFPGLGDPDAIKKLLELDIDVNGVLERTRLAGAKDPEKRTSSSSQEAHEYFYKLKASGERAAQQGNVVLSAIQKRRAARVAPPALAYETMEGANADLRGLLTRLQAALELSPAEAQEWLLDLPTLLDKADQGTHPPEAALLYDLQKVCLDFEQDIYTLDLVEWLLSLGKRPIKRPLPSQRLVRLTRHLRRASQRLTMARLSDSDRKHLAALLQSALQRSESRLRERFRPVFVAALEDVGLKPTNPPERIAFAKMIEEWLDRILAYGFLTFSDLRDSLSRNLLKLPDLTDPQDFIRGDPLLRLDRRLATLLDGVYRRSDFYLRWLERFTALNFGTVLGRMLTRFVTLPVGGAFLILAGFDRFVLQHVRRFDASLLFREVPGPDNVVSFEFEWTKFLTRFVPMWIAFSVFLFGLMHSPKVRSRVHEYLLHMWHPLRRLLIEGPIWLIHNPALKKFLKTWSFQLFYWYFLKPLLAVIVIYWLTRDTFGSPTGRQFWGWAVSVFFAANFLLNSGPGQALGRAITDVLVRFLDMLRAGLLPTLYRFIVNLFQSIMHFLEAGLFTVDEWLRVRSNESQTSLVIRAVLNVLWFPIAYLARFNLVVLIEPAFNPLKLPVASIATKFWAAPALILLAELREYNIVIQAIGWWFIFWFPDVFGFLFWEIKENWSLYRANRKPTLQPVMIGPSGETLRRLLQPGFHSGTIPKLFARLRHAERQAYASGHWSSVRSCQAALTRVQDSIRTFVTRDFLGLLEQNSAWRGISLKVGDVALATNQIRVELINQVHADEPAVLEFEIHAGWLVAGIDKPGWLAKLHPQQEASLHNALVTLYKLAGIDMIREQLRAVMPDRASYLDITPAGLAFRVDGRPHPAVHYNMQAPASERLEPKPQDGTSDEPWPILSSPLVLFSQAPVTWEQCVRSWQMDNGKPALRLVPDIAVLPTGTPGASGEPRASATGAIATPSRDDVTHRNTAPTEALS